MHGIYVCLYYFYATTQQHTTNLEAGYVRVFQLEKLLKPEIRKLLFF